MAKAFGFTGEELKLLLVAVRQMRRMFADPRRDDPSVETYAQLYDALFEKLRDMAGPLPDAVEDVTSESAATVMFVLPPTEEDRGNKAQSEQRSQAELEPPQFGLGLSHKVQYITSIDRMNRAAASPRAR